MTQLGEPIPDGVQRIRDAITRLCSDSDYRVIDAGDRVTSRDFLMKIWRLIASTPLSIGICHEDIPSATQMNIYYEFGVAQALGKEALLVKSPRAEIPSDFVRTEHIEFDNKFDTKFTRYLESLWEQADHYEEMADYLERNPILVLDYLKRAFLISGDERLREKAQVVKGEAGLDERARNSVELLAASF